MDMNILPILQRRRERKNQTDRSNQQRIRRAGLGCGLLISSALGLGILLFAFGYASLTADLPALESLPILLDGPDGLLRQPTRLYDRSGERVIATLAPLEGPRPYLPVDAARPDWLARITISLADPDFYAHPGFDWRTWNQPEAHPTLAQKLVADFLLWEEPPGLRRALRERILAAQITSYYGRGKILEWYLNSADYGRHAYGAESAAQLYFGKPASHLNLAEAAVLAAVSQSPAINPHDAPQAAIQRAHETLDRLPRWTAAPEDARAALAQELRFAPPPATNSLAPAFANLALAQLQNRARLERGGIDIITSLDYETQNQAQCAIRTQLARLAGEESGPDCTLQVALPPLPPGPPLESAASAAVIDPRDGQVLALVGDTRNGDESAILAGHRPGTSLLPFIYLTGFSRGLNPASLVWDIPQPDSVLPNLDDIYRGPIRARAALTGDSLAPAQTVLAQMGLAAVLQTMRPFGLPLSDTRDFAALLDGQNLVSPLTMARAYGVFATQGVLPAQTSALLAVYTQDGQTIWEWQPAPVSAVVSPQLSYLLNHVLADESLGRPAALKLSRTLDGVEAWAIGYTPSRAVALWMGGEGKNQRVVAGLFGAILQAASQNEAPTRWERPPGISLLQVCDPSGLLPTPACPNLVSEVFLNGFEPIQADRLYKTVQVNRETGLLATVFTPPELTEARVYMLVPPEAQAWAAATGLESPPTTYDTLQPAPNRDTLAITSPVMFAEIKGTVNIIGSAGGENFASYRLQYGQGLNPTHWVLIGENTSTPLKDGLLAEWNTSGLQGLYTLQLIVVDLDGRVESTAVQVRIID